MNLEIINTIPKLVGIDLETTGCSFSDRIVEIALLVYEYGELKETYVQRVNPGIHIPEETTLIHGIKDSDVADKPSFEEISDLVFVRISNAVLFGYNVKFDFNVLSQEMVRAKKIFLDQKKYQLLDPFVIWKKHDPKTLGNAYQFFCNKPLEGAHGALADISATYEVLQSQLTSYDDLPENYAELCNYCYPKDPSWVCSSYHFIFDKNGIIICNFGKNKRTPLEKLVKEQFNFCKWILGKEFPEDVKDLVRKAMNKEQLPVFDPK